MIDAQGAGTVLKFTLQEATLKGARADFINAAANSGSTVDLVIGGASAALGNTFDNLSAGSVHSGAAAGGNRITVGVTGTMTYDINNNILKGSKGSAIFVRSTGTAGGATGTASGSVRNNTVGVAGTVNSGSSESSGISIEGDGGSDHTTLVDHNSVFQYNNHGILLLFGDELNNGSVFAATVRSNTVNTAGTINTDFNGFHLNNGTVGATDDFTTTLNLHDNDFRNGGKGTVSPNNNDVRTRHRQSTTIVLPGYGGPARDSSDNVVSEVTTYFSATKANLFNRATANSSSGGGGYINGATPPLP